MIIPGNFETKEILHKAQILHVKTSTEMGFELMKCRKIISGDYEIINIEQDTNKNSS